MRTSNTIGIEMVYTHQYDGKPRDARSSTGTPSHSTVDPSASVYPVIGRDTHSTDESAVDAATAVSNAIHEYVEDPTVGTRKIKRFVTEAIKFGLPYTTILATLTRSILRLSFDAIRNDATSTGVKGTLGILGVALGYNVLSTYGLPTGLGSRVFGWMTGGLSLSDFLFGASGGTATVVSTLVAVVTTTIAGYGMVTQQELLTELILDVETAVDGVETAAIAAADDADVGADAAVVAYAGHLNDGDDESVNPLPPPDAVDRQLALDAANQQLALGAAADGQQLGLLGPQPDGYIPGALYPHLALGSADDLGQPDDPVDEILGRWRLGETNYTVPEFSIPKLHTFLHANKATDDAEAKMYGIRGPESAVAPYLKHINPEPGVLDEISDLAQMFTLNYDDSFYAVFITHIGKWLPRAEFYEVPTSVPASMGDDVPTNLNRATGTDFNFNLSYMLLMMALRKGQDADRGVSLATATILRNYLGGDPKKPSASARAKRLRSPLDSDGGDLKAIWRQLCVKGRPTSIATGGVKFGRNVTCYGESAFNHKERGLTCTVHDIT
jgi:hypothetical protein